MQSLQTATEDQLAKLLSEEISENAIQIFKKEGIDGKAFLLLEDKNMKELKLGMGDRLKLAQLLENIRKEQSRGVYIFIDNSNLWINAKRVEKPSYMTTKEDHRVRIEIGKLAECVSQGRIIRKVFVFGSRPPHADSVWEKMKEHGWEVVVKERNSWTSKEKGVDTQLVVGMLDVFYKQEPETIVLVSGDADMFPAVEYILKDREKNWRVEVRSWRDSTARCLKKLPERFHNVPAQVVFLDQESITFTEWKFNSNCMPKGSTKVVLHMEPHAFHNNKPTDDWCQELDAITQWPFQYYWADECEEDPEYLVLVFKQEWSGKEFNGDLFIQKVLKKPIREVKTAMSYKSYLKEDYYYVDEGESEDEDEDEDENEEALRCKYMKNCINGLDCPYTHSEKEKDYFKRNKGVGNRVRKVQRCRFYSQTPSACNKNAEDCEFAHGSKDAWCPKCTTTGHYMNSGQCAKN